MTIHGMRLATRLCSLLRNPHPKIPEMAGELLWILVNLTALRNHSMVCFMIQNGLVKTVSRLICGPNSEMALTILSNLVIDYKDAR